MSNYKYVSQLWNDAVATTLDPAGRLLYRIQFRWFRTNL